MSKNIFTDDNFNEEVLNSKIPVVIDLWAIWCGPCKLIAPIMDKLAVEYEGKLKIGKLDVDENPQIAIKYGVRSIPTVLYINNGEVKDMVIGAVHESVFRKKIEEMLNN